MLEEAMKTIEEELNKERDITRLEAILVNIMDDLIKAGKVPEVPFGVSTKMEFDMECIPKELRNLFLERLPVLWGEISNDESLEEKKHFYTYGFNVSKNKVTVGVERNW